MILKLFFITGIFSVKASVIKRDGETVTLNVNTTGHRFTNFLWTFGRHHPVEAITIVTNSEVTQVNGTRFEGRLHTDVETGSITISNLTVHDSGVFLVQILKETGIFFQNITLIVQDNGPIPVNVLEGNNVTLNSGLQELEKDHNVMWTQGQDFSGDQIAQWKDSIVTISESYQDILQMDPTTGDLVFLRVTKSLTGFYCVKILKGREPHVLRQYLLTVYGPVSVPNITTSQTNIRAELTNDGFCYASCSVENGPDVNLTWYQGEKQISQTSNNNISISLSLPLEIDKEETYTCEANNPVSTETTSIDSKQECPPNESGWNKNKVIVVVGSIVLVLVALIVYLIHRCINKRGGINCVEKTQMDSVQNNSEGNVEPLLDNNTQ